MIYSGLWKKLTSVSIFLFLGVAARVRAAAGPDFSVAAMGTVWTISLGHVSATLDRPALGARLQKIIFDYDLSFSDWNDQSELRRWERGPGGLGSWQRVSPLLAQGLLLSRELYVSTEHAFDITVGALLWKASDHAVGMNSLEVQIVNGQQRMRFAVNPRRLTFGGIAKGMAVGEVARVLWQAGIRDFRVNGGGGNVAISGAGPGGEPWPERLELAKVKMTADFAVYFVSRSAPMQGARQHIVDPQLLTRTLRGQTLVVCGSSAAKLQDWARESGVADALSTALLVRPALALPAACRASTSN